jgi:hypothetical protein
MSCIYDYNCSGPCQHIATNAVNFMRIMSSLCMKCGLYYANDSTHICSNMMGIDYNLPKPIPPTGWLCPACGRGNAPHVERCDCIKLQVPEAQQGQ